MCPYDVEEGEDDGAPACDVRLDEVLALPGDHPLYTYDYGDDWEHRLLVEQVADQWRRCCTGGRGAAPTEDSGGIWDWDAGAAAPFDLAAAQTSLALWELQRALPPEIAQLLQHVAPAPTHRYVVRGAAGHVHGVLDLVNAYEARGSVTTAGRVLARAALRPADPAERLARTGVTLAPRPFRSLPVTPPT